MVCTWDRKLTIYDPQSLNIFEWILGSGESVPDPEVTAGNKTDKIPHIPGWLCCSVT